MRTFVVVGMLFGDEGKGSVVDWLVREQGSSLVVRYNGGAQAAHHVATPEGLEHTFHQFGSGTLAGAETYLSEDVLVNPLLLAEEAAALMDLGVEEPFRHIYVHYDAPVTTPWHVALNRLRELARGDARHGSCGLGIAETMVDLLAGEALHFGELTQPNFKRRLHELYNAKLAVARRIPLPSGSTSQWHQEWGEAFGVNDVFEATLEVFDIVARNVNIVTELPTAEVVVFEGAQGILLDQDWGFAPYHTWSKTTSENARRILRGSEAETTVLGVLRAYVTRHGRGPLPTEEVGVAEPDATNDTNPWQEDFRQGWPDLALARYAANLDSHLDGLVVTCLDKLAPGPLLVGDGYQESISLSGSSRTEDMMQAVSRYRVSVRPDRIPALLSKATGLPIYATSRGPTAEAKTRAPAPLYLSPSA